MVQDGSSHLIKYFVWAVRGSQKDNETHPARDIPNLTIKTTFFNSILTSLFDKNQLFIYIIEKQNRKKLIYIIEKKNRKKLIYIIFNLIRENSCNLVRKLLNFKLKIFIICQLLVSRVTRLAICQFLNDN